jgi:hypothetical protein
LAVGTFTSCENEIIKFDESKYFVAFLGNSSAPEQGGAIGIPVMVAAELGSPAINVTFTVGADVLGTAAVEGSDFTVLNSTTELTFADGWGYDTIWIQPTDNDIFTGNKELSLTLTSNSLDYDFGAFSTAIVTLIDNEHPLKDYIGTYTVDAKSYGVPGDWDEAWTVVTEADPEDTNNLLFTGIGTSGGGYLPVIGTFDLEAMTITFAAGTDAGDAYGYGSTLIYAAEGYPNLLKTINLVGTISEDGSMHVDQWGMEMNDQYKGDVWDVFDTYWTMNKSASLSNSKKINDSKLNRFRK